MTNRFRPLLCALLAIGFAGAPRLSAQTADLESHPAVKAVNDYLGMIFTRQWDRGVDVVDQESVRRYFNDYVKRVASARTLDEEETLLHRVGKEKLEDLRKMAPADWYAAYNSGLSKEHKLGEERQAEVRRTLKMKTIGVVPDGESLVHVLTRANFSNGEVNIEHMEMTTLRKNEGKWRVVIDGREPKVTPLEGAAKPGAAPAPATAPADPVKPAPKPAPKPPTTKPKPR